MTIKVMMMMLACVLGSLAAGGCRKEVQLPEPAVAETALTPATDDREIAVSHRPSAGEPTLDEAAPPKTPEEFRDRAAEAFEADDVETADRLIRKAITGMPNDPEANFLMAQILAAKYRFAEAIRRLDRLAEATEKVRLPVLGQTAEWLEMHGEWEMAEARYRAILDEVPDASMAHRKLASLLLRQGRRIEAARHLRRLCELGDVEELELRSLLVLMVPLPGDAGRNALEPVTPLGRARRAISEGNITAAIEELTEPKRDVDRCRALLGRVYAEQKDAGALESWAESISEPIVSSADYWVAMGVRQSDAGDHDAAIKSFGEAILLDPTDKFAYYSISRSLAAVGADEASKAMAARAGLIAQTHAIGVRMATQDTGDVESIGVLADLLQSLRRPFESLCWRAVQVMNSRTATQGERLAAMERINRERLRLLQQDESDASEEFLLGGTDLESLGPAQNNEPQSNRD